MSRVACFAHRILEEKLSLLWMAHDDLSIYIHSAESCWIYMYICVSWGVRREFGVVLFFFLECFYYRAVRQLLGDMSPAKRDYVLSLRLVVRQVALRSAERHEDRGFYKYIQSERARVGWEKIAVKMGVKLVEVIQRAIFVCAVV